ncbi:MAG: hypothetical protein RJA81_87 [Planctomycetota bacterium]|jgi:4'-phosphopantetheinyl transferase
MTSESEINPRLKCDTDVVVSSDLICWYCDPMQMTDPVADHVFGHYLSESERQKNQRYRNVRDKKLHLTARFMTRQLLSRVYPEIQPSEWKFESDSHGKPFIQNVLTSPLHFNITHTQGLVAVVISRRGPVGIDAESIDRPIDHLGLASRFFSKREFDTLESVSETDRAELFYRIWTLKEAYVKAIGKGLAYGLDTFWFEPQDLACMTPRLMHMENTNTSVRPGQNCESQAHVRKISIGDSRWMLAVVSQTLSEIQQGLSLNLMNLPDLLQ